MKVEYANVFIKSAVAVFLKEVNVHLTRKDLARKESPVPGRPIAIIMGITGFIRGQIVYAMDQSFAYGVAKAMLPNSLPLESRQMANSAISEIANIITGQATIYLAGHAEKLYITPPVVIMATDLTLDFLAIPTIALSLLSEIGVLEINIALTENVAFV